MPRKRKPEPPPKPVEPPMSKATYFLERIRCLLDTPWLSDEDKATYCCENILLERERRKGKRG